MTQWTEHICGDEPSYRCAACWAEAYDEDDRTLAENLSLIGYPPRKDATDATE